MTGYALAPDIPPVPGSGPIKKTWVIGDSLYAVRNDESGDMEMVYLLEDGAWKIILGFTHEQIGILGKALHDQT